MSQSDYIQRKKMSKELNIGNQAKFPHILTADDYTHYKQYSLENTITNSSKRYNQQTPIGKKVIFNMEVSNTTTCPSFNLCTNTQNRKSHVNIKPISFNPSVSGHLPYINSYTSVYTSNQLKYVKHRRMEKCGGCCLDKQSKINSNSWVTPCSIARKKHLICDCSMN